jgi:predicted porin
VSTQTAWNLGVGVRLGAGELLAQLVRQKLDMASGPGQEGDTIGIGYTYPVSKRTNLYLAYGETRNNAAGTFGLRSGAFIITPAIAGDDPKGFAAGIRHTF